jgi:hypothetical protein
MRLLALKLRFFARFKNGEIIQTRCCVKKFTGKLRKLCVEIREIM